EQRADDQAVERGDGAQGWLQRGAPDDARPRYATRQRRQDERFGDGVAHGLRLQTLQRRSHRQRNGGGRHEQVLYHVERTARSKTGGGHAADGKPSGSRRDEHQEQRREQRRHGQKGQRRRSDRDG